MTNPKHQLARVVMDAVVAGSKLGHHDQAALGRELLAAAERRRERERELRRLRAR